MTQYDGFSFFIAIKPCHNQKNEPAHIVGFGEPFGPQISIVQRGVSISLLVNDGQRSNSFFAIPFFENKVYSIGVEWSSSISAKTLSLIVDGKRTDLSKKEIFAHAEISPRKFVIGQSLEMKNGADFYFYEKITYNRPLTSSEAQKLSDYLLEKHGLDTPRLHFCGNNALIPVNERMDLNAPEGFHGPTYVSGNES